MQTIVNSLNKLLPVGKRVKKYLPFFIGFKLLTFTGFLTYIMNRWMILPSQEILFNLLAKCFVAMFNLETRFNSFKDKK